MGLLERHLAARLALAAAILVGANVLGVVRSPVGPIASDDGPGGSWSGNSEGATDVRANEPMLYGMVSILNPGPWPITIEEVHLLSPVSNIVLDRVAVAGPGFAPDGMWAWAPVAMGPGMAAVDSRTEPLPVVVHPASEVDGAATSVILILHAPMAGNGGFDRVEIDYRVGPLTFRAVQNVGLRGCFGPLPPGGHCVDEHDWAP